MKILSIGHHLPHSASLRNMTHPNKMQLEAIRYAGYDQFWTTPGSVREMAAGAALNALQEAGIQAEDVGFIVAGLSGIPDFIGIDLACQVGAELHCTQICTVNLVEGCGSAVSVWIQAAARIRELPPGRVGLVVLAQRISDTHQDRFGLMNAVLSDGAAAAVVVGDAEPSAARPGFRFIAAEDMSDCRYVDMMRIEHGGGHLPLLPEGRDSRQDKTGRERIMELYQFSISDLTDFLALREDNSVKIIQRVIEKTGRTLGSPCLLHTLEGRQSIESLCKRIGIPAARSNLSLLPELGHVGCVDSLLSLKMLTARGTIRPADEVIMSTISTGLKWGASLFRYENVH